MDYTLLADKLKLNISLLNKASISIVLLTLLSILSIFFVNARYTHFTALEYLPHSLVLYCALKLTIIFVGCKVLLDPKHFFIKFLNRLIVIYGVVALTALYTTAIQVTPFSPIDPSLVKIDQYLGVDMPQILHFVHNNVYLNSLLSYAYAFLTPELTFTMLYLIFFYEKRSQELFIFLMLSSALVGFSIYYFLPTIAPASIINSPFFLNDQHQTHIKFELIHNYLPAPQSLAGGLIAMPSFHCIWALICQYYLMMRSKVIGYLVLPLNISLILSCLLLGWHYLIDIIASFIIVLSLIILAKRLSP